MQVDWKRLATEIGGIDKSGTYLSKKALGIILGEEFFERAVEYTISMEAGWCLSEGVLRVLRPLGMEHCYKIYKNSNDIELRRGAVYLMQYAADREVLEYLPEFLADPDEQIQNAVIQILDRCGEEIHDDEIIPILELAVNHPNEKIRNFAIGEVAGDPILGIPQFVEELSDALWYELHRWKSRLKFETIHGFDLQCKPWQGQIKISFLTSQEDFDLAEAYTDESYSEWRFYDLPFHNNLIKDATLWMLNEHEKSGRSLQSLEIFLEACAIAVKSFSVREVLNEFDLAGDFQITIINPSTSQPRKNYYINPLCKPQGN